jgi:large subunit ribosomal protein L21
MAIAVIKTGGRQYKVKVGDIIKVEKINKEKDSTVNFEVLLLADEKNVQIGKPVLKEKVQGKILKQEKSKKISVIKYKPKTRYKRNLGHQQPYTEIEITKI